ncbi:YadA-like family protein [Qipengyuania sp. GH38]|uniref:YadA-like family protein n=1 Tax=Qipengyuania intermedia TaxID=2867244 RepID=UPI001C8864D7|nr:YadA-like family protein [Qipengyuania intermedia]MBX7514263.1 YadA-like family protein [Qipengyuania intermedia]
MRTMNIAGRAAVAGLMTSVAGGALLVASPAAAQASDETCFRYTNGSLYCTEPGDVDYYRGAGEFDQSGVGDGAYDNLDTKIEQSAPSEAEVTAAQAELDAANDAAETLAADQTAVEATLTDDNLAAFEDVATTEAALEAAQAAELEALAAQTDAQTAFDAAADDLTEANVALGAAQTDLADAQDAVDTAQANYDANQTTANLAALNDALADRADAQLALDAAEEDRADALAVANDAAADLTAAQTAFNDAAAATVAANDDFSDALTALDTSLASNTDFVDAITDAGYTADASGLNTLSNDAVAAADQAVVEQAQFDALDDATNTFARAQDVLVPAAENQNAAIAAASQALLGDPRADETNAEVEVIAALVDHEERISTNTADIATNAANIADNSARITVVEETLVEYDTRITANADAIVAESEARAAADAQLLDQLTAEENARIAGDAALQSQIDGIGGRVDLVEARIDQLDDRIASSTATAIALGGMGFLPDTRFNLSVAGGFYEGANAIAANAGIRVSDKVAITAGIGGGLNKNGKVGGRVGIIFGW